jgi:hypothetical protein
MARRPIDDTGPEAAIASKARALRTSLGPWACAIAGACLGLLGGWFGIGAGFLLGAMLDVARIEARERRRVAAFLERPKVGPRQASPREPAEGYAAAACIALRGDWLGTADLVTRRALFEDLAREEIAMDAGSRRDAERVADVAARCARADLPSLARNLASAEDGRSRSLLASWAYSLAALGGARLDPASELGIRALLADCGIGEAAQLAARARAFPGEHDPWATLGLRPGAARAEVKRAYRRLSRLFHPDALAFTGSAEGGTSAASSADGGERFRELSSAYALLMRNGPRRAEDSPASSPRRP